MKERRTTWGQLLQELDVLASAGDAATPVAGLTQDSRQVQAGQVFVALSGARSRGADHLAEALARGACGVIQEESAPPPAGPWAQVRDIRRALSRAAAHVYGHPSRELLMCGVTGTNGKTTVSILLQEMLRHNGFPCGRLGTLGYDLLGRQESALQTTPEADTLQRLLREMRQAGASACAMEVSSHSLALSRVADCRFDLAIFTNLTQDHLDFHRTLDDYFAAKQRLFTERLDLRGERAKVPAVINTDDLYGRRLQASLACRTFGFGRAEGDFTIRHSRCGREGIEMAIQTPRGPLDLASPLVGDFHQYNLLAAAAAGYALGFEPSRIAAGLAQVKNIPGRLERVSNRRGLSLFVDYAHTPDALENVLRAARRLCPGRLICVFGCGGDRDRGKRPRMGAAAAALGDLCLITSDNPRSEEPHSILQQIVAGLPDGYPGLSETDLAAARRGYLSLVDRRAAIALALRAATENDLVLIAGKGHETYQEINGVRRPFDDRQVARQCLGEET